jgi:hypothetical protein
VPEPLREPVFGIAEGRNGWLWITNSNPVLRDGPLGSEGVMVRFADPTGKIWFSMNRGLSVVDPNQATSNSVPALLHIETVTLDGNTVDRQIPIRFSSANQRIRFSYTGLSLSSCERDRYRYRLDGFDRDWSEPTTRTAIYTNLSPRSYRYRVIASNSDGFWNGAEAAVGLRVTLWQTWWFRLGS